MTYSVQYKEYGERRVWMNFTEAPYDLAEALAFLIQCREQWAHKKVNIWLRVADKDGKVFPGSEVRV